MARKNGMALGVAAIVIYVVGGVLTFTGIALAAFMKGHDLFGWGDGRSMGWLLLCAGICLSLIGVMLMRLFRNRGLT